MMLIDLEDLWKVSTIMLFKPASINFWPAPQISRWKTNLSCPLAKLTKLFLVLHCRYQFPFQ